MRICNEVLQIKHNENYYSILTNCIEIQIYFITDDIIRILAGFDADFPETSYSLITTAWDSITDDFMKDERTRIPSASSTLSNNIIQGKNMKIIIHEHPFYLSIYDQEGTLIHEDIPDLSYLEDANKRRKHTSRIEADDHFYGFGETTGQLDKAEETITLSPGDAMGYNPVKTESLYKHIPFYIKLSETTKKATGYFYHNTAECSFNMGRQKRNYWHRYSTYATDANNIDLFLINGPKIKDVIQRYTDLTGKSALLPKAAYGYLGSSMYYPELPKDCDDAIIEFIDTTKEENIPMDGFQLSSGYCAIETKEGIKRCTFTWNKKRFKDPAKFFEAMKERNIIVSPNIKPGFLLNHPLLDEMKEKGMFIDTIGTWWGGKGLFIDFTNPKTRDHWKTYIKDNLLQYGCESIWNDNCEYDSIIDQDAQVYLEGKKSTIGKTRTIMANLMCKLSNQAMLEYHPDKRPFTVCRAGHAGIQRYAQVWAGDNYTSWQTLKYNIPTILNMGLSGVANHGCDIGGFYGPSPEPELFLRWVQNGIFQPRFSIHSTNTDNTVTEPWMYSQFKPLIKDTIHFRYQLNPYFYSLAKRANETGLPILSAECMVFQDDPNTYKQSFDFLLGDFLLISSVLEKGQTQKEIYLPKCQGLWYDYTTRESYQPGTTITKEVNLISIPLFIPSGCILPLSMNHNTNLNEPTKDLKILLAPDIDSTFTLYEDDGISNDYQKGIYLKTHIHVTSGIQTSITFTHEGCYQTPIETIHLDVIHRQKAPFYILINNQEIKHHLHRKKFEASESGWYYSQTLKSVQIKYPNPKQDHEVLISFEQFDLLGM